MKFLLSTTLAFTALFVHAKAVTVTANFTSADTIPITAANYTATGNDVSLALGFAPAVGTSLTVVKNTGLAFIQGRFSNLAQGQPVNLAYNSGIYQFIANYYGGSGNDLVLQWSYSQPVAWGRNNYGQLGNNSTTDSSVPVYIYNQGTLNGKYVTAIAGGFCHNLALCSDGTVAAWGLNSSGQLGNGTTANSSVPVSVTYSGALSGKFVVAISAGNNHSLALCSDGTVAAWGDNTYGQLGNNSTTSSNVPVLVTQSGVLAGKSVVAVTTGRYISSALCSDGTVAAWGYNGEGELGNNNTTNSSVPVAVNNGGVLAGRTVVSIASAYNHSLALCSDGTVAAWGSNDAGQLGNSSYVNSSVPVVVTNSGVLAGKTVVAIAADQGTGIALCSDNSMAAWGQNNVGQLGNNTTTYTNQPVSVIFSGALTGKTVVSITGTADNSAALCSDGSVATWGGNNYGQLGNNSKINSLIPVTVSTASLGMGVKLTSPSGTRIGSHTLALAATPPPSSLASLTLSSGTLNPAFAATTTSYTASVSNPITGITVTPTVTDSTATVKVNGTTVVSGTASASIPLVVGANLITVLVTAQDGTTTTTYTVTVTRGSTGSNLSGLVLSMGTLIPAFATASTSYAASVPNATSSITVTPTVTDPTATVKVNGTTVASGTASTAIALAIGNNTITVLVTAQDGTTTTSYTVTVTRFSNVSTLSTLTLSSGTLSPSFAAATKVYTASVANAITALTVTPTLTNSYATVTVNGTPVTSGTASASIPLTVGTNTITVLVTAQDGTSTTTYTVTLTRFSADSTLATLGLSAGTLSPVFASGTLGYTSSVSNATTGITVTPTVTHPAATVKVNGVGVASGVASASIPLAVGSNVIAVLVTAQDNNFSSTYTVSVTRAVLNATFASATTVPCTLANFTSPANVVNLALAYAPSAGTNLMVVRNAGLGFITGRFSNWAQGQVVILPYSNDSYRFVANYYGGSGNDLVLQWADNRAYTWGSNSLGQLGDNDSASSSVPVAVTTSGVLGNKTIVSLAVGSSHSVALCSDGTIAAWGNDTYGQLGDGTNNNSNVPVAVTASGVLSGQTVVAVAAGFNHSLALCADGTVVAWGMNSAGQLGNGSNTSSNVPVAVTKTGALLNKTVVAIAAGYNHSLARCADGTVVTWGNNAYGQLGNNSTTNSNVPVDITTSGELNGRTVIYLVGGSDHSIGLCSDGSLVSWGRNNYGQLGNDSTVNSSIPVVVDASDVLAGKAITAIATGGWHTLALCSDGTLAAFGRNNNGQLGNNSTADSGVAVNVNLSGVLANKTITAIGGSNAHSLAPCADGTLAAWGSNNNGQLGNNSTTGSSVPVEVSRTTLGTGMKFTDLATGSSASHVLALTAFHVSSNSTLSGLTVSGGTLMPAFDSATTAYTVSMPNVAASVTVTPTVAEANASVKVNGASVVSGTPSAAIPLVAGTNTIQVDVTAQDGVSVTAYVLTIDNSSYGVWKSSVFTNPADVANPAVSGELATPAHDGITNLMKYALGLDPMACGNGGLPSASPQGGYLTLTYRKNKQAADVTYTVQATDSLTSGAWLPATMVLGQSDEGTYWNITVRDTVPLGQHPHRFMRLQVAR